MIYQESSHRENLKIERSKASFKQANITETH